VSSEAQKPDLQNQQAALEKFCQQQAIEVDEWVLEVGGLNFERKQFLRLVLAHQDRLVRFGYQLLAHLCQTHLTELVVMNTQTLSPEQELVQHWMAITQCFASRLDGLRNYRKALKKALADENRAQDTDQPDA
jgi:putative resolvase